MMQIRELPDDELMTLAREWRLRALRGEKDARGIAHELEREQRQRVKMQSSSSGETTFYERSTSKEGLKNSLFESLRNEPAGQKKRQMTI